MVMGLTRGEAVPGDFILSSVFKYMIIAAAGLAGQVAAAGAATIEKSESPHCAMVIRGDIVPGDFEKFVAASAMLPESDGESTANAKVCLDSRGGSLSEGVKFASYFHKQGIGTVIDAGQGCFSSCAIMFMMGVAKGDEVNFLNRMLHVAGRLGFHRPFIDIESDRTDDVDALSASYDRALQSALDLIALANSQAPWSSSSVMKSDLLQAMLQHVGRDMFMIDTIDKVGRWQIEPFGYAKPKLLTMEHAYYACQTELQWQTSLMGSDVTYRERDPPLVKRIEAPQGRVAYEVEGMNHGYVNAGCIISSDYTYVYGCGMDESTSVVIGRGPCDATNFVEQSYNLRELSVFDPETSLASLNPGAETPDASEASDARCVVLRGTERVDDGPCDIEAVEAASVGLPDARVTQFVWPSGGKTILVQHRDRLEINGVRTFIEFEPLYGTCYPNRETGNRFCVKEN